MLTKAAEELLERMRAGVVVGYRHDHVFTRLDNGRGCNVAAKELIAAGLAREDFAGGADGRGKRRLRGIKLVEQDQATAHKARCDAVSVEAVALLQGVVAEIASRGVCIVDVGDEIERKAREIIAKVEDSQSTG